MFDAIMRSDPIRRVFRYIDADTQGAAFGYVNTRQGDRIGSIFLSDSAFIRGYNEASPLSPAPANALVDRAVFAATSPVPGWFRRFRRKLKYEGGTSTFCIWRSRDARKWCTLPLLLGSEDLAVSPFYFLEMFTGDPEPFVNWVREYYERRNVHSVIDSLYKVLLQTLDMVRVVRSDVEWQDVRNAAITIGYPAHDRDSQ
jgi:hypothetical protein